mgnify:CR=1 FL=1
MTRSSKLIITLLAGGLAAWATLAPATVTPDEPHPVPDAPQIRKLQQAMSAAGTRTPLVPLIHGYGPDDDFQRRLQLVATSSVPGVWINRYGYLNDSKLSLIASM